jgi:hypothetical protein
LISSTEAIFRQGLRLKPRINVLESLASSFDERRNSMQQLGAPHVGLRQKPWKIDNKRLLL